MSETVRVKRKELNAIVARLQALQADICRGSFPLETPRRAHPSDTVLEIVADIKRLVDQR